MGTEVLLFVPNIIGYIRIILLLIASLLYSHPTVFIPVYVSAALLDGVDGIAARKLNQVSAFGAWLDVLIDVIARSLLWCNLYRLGFLVSCLEWLTFVCTHSQRGAHWKSVNTTTPIIVQKIMEKNFKTIHGVYAVISLFGLPVWLYAHYTGYLEHVLGLPRLIEFIGIGLLSGGRAVCCAVEVWFIGNHVQFLIADHSPTDKEAEQE